MSNQWVPEICYEDSEGGLTSKIPFIHVPDDQSMPRMLFIFESHDTGEYEPGLEGEEIPNFSFASVFSSEVLDRYLLLGR